MAQAPIVDGMQPTTHMTHTTTTTAAKLDNLATRCVIAALKAQLTKEQIEAAMNVAHSVLSEVAKDASKASRTNAIKRIA